MSTDQVAPATTTTPTVTVVICCYTDRRRREIVAAVASVQAQSPPPAEVIVVVDHNPGLRAWLAGCLRGVTLIGNTASQGLTGARNTGVAASTGDVVAFLDDDAVAEPDWLRHLVAEYASPNVIGVGGRIDPLWAAPSPAWWPAEFGWVVGCSYTGQPRTRSVVRNVIGANMSFRRAVVEASGGFRQELGRVGALPAGCEETELCIRASALTGGQVVYQPSAAVGHHVPADRGSWSYFRSRCYGEGVSKSIVATMVGQDTALATETRYVTHVLSAAVLRALLAGRFGRAAVIVAGFAITTAGYGTGRLRLALGARRS